MKKFIHCKDGMLAVQPTEFPSTPRWIKEADHLAALRPQPQPDSRDEEIRVLKEKLAWSEKMTGISLIQPQPQTAKLVEALSGLSGLALYLRGAGMPKESEDLRARIQEIETALSASAVEPPKWNALCQCGHAQNDHANDTIGCLGADIGDHCGCPGFRKQTAVEPQTLERWLTNSECDDLEEMLLGLEDNEGGSMDHRVRELVAQAKRVNQSVPEAPTQKVEGELRRALEAAHKVFGAECDRLGEIIKRLQAASKAQPKTVDGSLRAALEQSGEWYTREEVRHQLEIREERIKTHGGDFQDKLVARLCRMALQAAPKAQTLEGA